MCYNVSALYEVRYNFREIAVVSIALLLTYNVYLTVILIYGMERPKEVFDMKQNMQLFNLNLWLGRWDNKREYKLFDHFLVGEKFVELSEKYIVCLSTQASLEKMSSIIETTKYWSGPLSVALFVVDNEDLNMLLMYVLYLRKCFKNIRDQISFHLAFPKKYKPETISINVLKLAQLDCEKSDAALEDILVSRSNESLRRKTVTPYPQNHMRNLARKNCQTEYVFVSDIDVIPSSNMAKLLNEYLINSNCKKKCVYVIPTYEVEENVTHPANKMELKGLVRSQLARPFHYGIYNNSHRSTNYKRWENYSDDDSKVHICHEAKYTHDYEPFFVSKDTVPPYDERFIGYGSTRNTQTFEANQSGHTFHVLSPIFTYHRGLQVLNYSRYRKSQKRFNSKLSKIFKREIIFRYSN